MDIVTARDIQAALLLKGYSCRSWAIAHGYYPRTVQKCIQRHAPEHNREIKGELYCEILRELSKTIGFELVGGKHE
ncbi:hypothetical protein D5E85_12935 [Vibrio parahaemolyticus]|nr:hypothetical protein D5E85_12935 [Vibrio parahaemolyticus]TOL25208.1 hypothetical protein CGI02_13505 [Vibrio parahaemolyticus]